MDEFKKTHKKLWQFVEYLFTGGIYFWVGYLLLDGFYYGLHWNLWWSTIVSSFLGWIINYLMQRYWVFKNSNLGGHKTKITGRYAVITLVDFLISYLILLGLKKVGITPAIGQFIGAAFFTGWNYFWYRFWVFPDKADALKLRLTIHHIFAHRAHGLVGFGVRNSQSH